MHYPIRLGVMFAGGGIGTASLPAGCHVVWAIEYDSAIAAVHSLNHPDTLTIVEDVSAVNYDSLPGVDILQASPVCKAFSKASGNDRETDRERDQAESICSAIRALRPSGFILENVREYMGSKSLQLIGQTLYDLDYCVDQQFVCAADYGVPQDRHRFILRAKAGGMFGHLPPIPGRVSQQMGWYAAIEDLIPTLPVATLNPWHITRLTSFPETSFLINGNLSKTNGHAFLQLSPMGLAAGTITAIYSSMKDTRAVLVDMSHSSRPPSIIAADRPSMTIQSWHGRRVSHIPLSWIDSATVVRMTSRAMARFQSLPDSYRLPDDPRLAIKIIGNGVPSKLGGLLIQSMID